MLKCGWLVQILYAYKRLGFVCVYGTPWSVCTGQSVQIAPSNLCWLKKMKGILTKDSNLFSKSKGSKPPFIHFTLPVIGLESVWRIKLINWADSSVFWSKWLRWTQVSNASYRYREFKLCCLSHSVTTRSTLTYLKPELTILGISFAYYWQYWNKNCSYVSLSSLKCLVTIDYHGIFLCGCV